MSAVPLKKIGILGGMGPEATILLMSRIVAATPATDDMDHVPLLVDNNTQVPSRIKALIEKDGDDPAPVLAEMARRLELAGAEALAMACNTAHHYAEIIRQSVAIPFLDIIDLTVQRVAQIENSHGQMKVGMLSSPAIELTRQFEIPFARRGIETLYPMDPGRLLGCIKKIKAGLIDSSVNAAMIDAMSELQDRGADVLVIACSELSIVARTLSPNVPLVDSIDVLADAIVAFSRGARVPQDRSGMSRAI